MDYKDKSTGRNRDTLISAEENRRMFDNISGHYDIMNSVMSMGMHIIWRKKAAGMLSPVAGGHYLDIGCGTGDISMVVIKKEPGARVTGIDVSRKMLDAGMEKIKKHGLAARINLQPGDAMSLPFRDKTFDGIITGFCIRNVPDRQKAIAEMRRVLVPGARTVILELTVPESGLIAAGYSLYTGTLIPLTASLVFRRKAYKYLRESIRDFPTPNLFEKQIASAGFKNVKSIPLSFGAVTIFTGEKPL